MVLVCAFALAAPVVGAEPSGGEAGGPLELEIHPGGGPRRTGEPQTVEARVKRADGGGVNGVEVDFEVTEGPGDDDVGTAGHTPETPDMSCTTAGGDRGRFASCTVTYAEQDNDGGSDAVLAWVDGDRLDATVEADLEEGENQHASGSGGCLAATKGPGTKPEPDNTDCIEKRWMARVAHLIDLQPEAQSAPVGASGVLEATVHDQFGDLFAGPDRSTTVHVELLAGSAHDPGDGTDFTSPDLGFCDTGTTGRCSLPFVSSKPGEDRLCGYLPGHEVACAELSTAQEHDNGADVVQRSWLAPPLTPPAPDASGGVLPPAPAPVRPEEPRSRPRPRDEPPRRNGGDRRDDHKRAPARHGDDAAAQPTPPATAPPAAPPPAAISPTSAARNAAATKPARPRRRAEPAGDGRRRSRPRGGTSIPLRLGGTPRRPAAAQHAERYRPPAKPPRPGRVERRLKELSRAAVTTADRYSFPLGLTLMVVGFLAVQSRIDRRDPKLRLAPLDSKHDLTSFS